MTQFTIFLLSKSFWYTFDCPVSFKIFLANTFSYMVSCLTFGIRHVALFPKLRKKDKECIRLCLSEGHQICMETRQLRSIYIFSNLRGSHAFSHNVRPLVSRSIESKHARSSAHCVSFSQSITPFLTSTKVI